MLSFFFVFKSQVRRFVTDVMRSLLVREPGRILYVFFERGLVKNEMALGGCCHIFWQLGCKGEEKLVFLWRIGFDWMWISVYKSIETEPR